MPPQINFKEEDGAAESDGDFVDMDGGQEEELDELQDDMPAAHADASALPKALCVSCQTRFVRFVLGMVNLTSKIDSLESTDPLCGPLRRRCCMVGTSRHCVVPHEYLFIRLRVEMVRDGRINLTPKVRRLIYLTIPRAQSYIYSTKEVCLR